VTFRLTLGVDPGQTGAIAALADGVPVGFVDIPLRERPKGGGVIVDGRVLAARLRGLASMHRGAHIVAVIERVQAIGGKGPGGNAKGSPTSGFRFGQADGILRGVLECLGLPLIEVEPQEWKKHHGLLGTSKDTARLLAKEMFPTVRAELGLKGKGGGRADALLIAAWHDHQEQLGPERPEPPARRAGATATTGATA
jgi:hypothetical protein